MERIPKGYIQTANEKPEITAEQYGHMVGVDFKTVYADKQVMEEFEKILNRKTKKIKDIALRLRIKPRAIGVMERHLLLAEIYKRRIAYRARADIFREKFGECLKVISKPRTDKNVEDCCEHFTMENTKTHTAYDCPDV